MAGGPHERKGSSVLPTIPIRTLSQNPSFLHGNHRRLPTLPAADPGFLLHFYPVPSYRRRGGLSLLICRWYWGSRVRPRLSYLEHAHLPALYDNQGPSTKPPRLHKILLQVSERRTPACTQLLRELFIRVSPFPAASFCVRALIGNHGRSTGRKVLLWRAYLSLGGVGKRYHRVYIHSRRSSLLAQSLLVPSQSSPSPPDTSTTKPLLQVRTALK